MRIMIKNLLNSLKPDIIIMEIIDSYLHDILAQEADMLKIKKYAFVQSFINGYSRMSIRGELNYYRDPSKEEVNRVLISILNKNYTPNYIVKKKNNLFIAYAKTYIGNILRVAYFFIIRIIKNEKYNYHYWTSLKSNLHINFHIIPRLRIGNNNWKNIIKKSKKPIIFVPLQHYPEATIDYWCEDIKMVDYENQLIKLIKKLENDFQILIKEHPATWGNRKPSFYKKLKESSTEIIIAPTKISAKECIQNADAVLIWTGTVGFEAALEGCPVLTIANPYFNHGKRFLKIDNETQIMKIKEFIITINGDKINYNEQYEMVNNLLKGLIKSEYKIDGTFNAELELDSLSAEIMAKWIKNNYLK
jgi:hypothetical protein